MRTREMTITDYGIDESCERELLEMATMPENQKFLSIAANVSNSYLAPYLVRSLTSGRYQDGRLKLGYRSLFKGCYYRPCKEDDFYAYRRLTLAIFHSLIKSRQFAKMPQEYNLLYPVREETTVEVPEPGNLKKPKIFPR